MKLPKLSFGISVLLLLIYSAVLLINILPFEKPFRFIILRKALMDSETKHFYGWRLPSMPYSYFLQDGSSTFLRKCSAKTMLTLKTYRRQQ